MEDGDERGLSPAAVQNGRRQTRAAQTTTSHTGDKSTIGFQGRIFGSGPADNAIKHEAITALHQAEEEERRPIPGKVTMAILTSAACAPPPADSAAYSVLYNVYAPNHNDHLRPAEMAWYLPSTGNILLCAVVAIAQGIHIANETLRALPTTNQRPEKASIKIFTSFSGALRSISDPRRNRRNYDHFIYHQAITLVHNLSRELGNITGIEVELDLHWLPVVYNGPATETAKECATVKQEDMFSLGIGRKAASDMPRSIALVVEQWLETKKSTRSMPTTSTTSCTTPSLAFPGPYIPVVIKTNEDSTIPPVSLKVSPGTDQPLWWRDLGPFSLSTASAAEEEVVSVFEAEGEESLLEDMEEPMSVNVTDEAQQSPSREPVPVNQHSPPDKEVRIGCLQREIIALREDINKQERLVDEKVQELRQLAGEHTLVWLASFSHEQPSFLRRYL